MQTLEKKCHKCREMKPLSEFSVYKRSKDGLHYLCRVCKNEELKLYRNSHQEECRLSTAKWKKNNLERYHESNKRYREKHREEIRARSRAFHIKNREQELVYKKQWCRDHAKEVLARTKQWQKKNREKYLESARQSAAKRSRTAKGCLNNRVRSSLYTSLKGVKRGRSWESLVGYTCDDLMSHLEKKFLPGMTWENREEWEIDHIIPVAAFNFQTAEDIDFKKCWALKNLRPLWATVNQQKSAKLIKPFQPSLAING